MSTLNCTSASMANSDEMSRLNSAPALVGIEHAGNALPVTQGVGRTRSAPEVGETVSSGNASSAHLPKLLDVAHALTVMMDGIRALQERMVSIAGALGNAADVSGARGFLTDFARDASQMHARLAGIAVQPAHVEQVAPVVADNMPVAIPTAAIVTDVPAPTVAPITAAPAAARVVASTPPVVAAVATTPQPVIVDTIDAVPAHILPPAATLANPSPVALAAATTRMTPPAGTASGSTAHTVTHAMAAPRATLSNITLPAMPTFTLQTDPVPWLTGLRARLQLYNYEDATCLNVAISLLTPEVPNVWAHAFPAGTHCTFDDFCEWLQSNFGKHAADDDIIRKLQTLRQHGRIAAYCAEFLAYGTSCRASLMNHSR